MDTHSNLNKILAGIKNNPENKTFNAICKDIVSDTLSLELIHEYESELTENRFIREDTNRQHNAANYILTVNGQRFIDGGGYSKHENNWFLKENYSNLKWIIGVAMVITIAAAGWKISNMVGR